MPPWPPILVVGFISNEEFLEGSPDWGEFYPFVDYEVEVVVEVLDE